MSDELLAPGAIFAGRYTLLRHLGLGGVARVYEVEDRITGRRRALKLWHAAVGPAIRRRFEREVMIGAKIESENVVEVLDAGIAPPPDERPFLVMELLVGEGLDQHLARVGRLSFEDARLILDQIARTLEKAHAKSIVHRDLKPSNVFLVRTDDGALRVKILDFGLAALLRDDADTTKTLVGTPLYMPPEQVTLDAKITPATDLYVLGLMAYEMLVGEHYRQGGNIGNLLRAALSPGAGGDATERAAVGGVILPPGFDAWMRRAIALAPGDRWPDARTMVNELARVLALEAPRPAPMLAHALAPSSSEVSVPAQVAPGSLPESAPVSTGVNLGVTQDFDRPATVIGVSGAFNPSPRRLRPLFGPMLPRRMAAEAEVVLQFLAEVFDRFEVVSENVVSLTRAAEDALPFRYFATFMLELEASAVHTQTFVDYARPLEDTLADLPRDGRVVVLAIMEATELGRGVRDVIYDFRKRFAAQIVPLHIGEVRRAVADGGGRALVRSRLKALHPRLDVFDTRASSPTSFFGLDERVGEAAGALQADKPLLVITGGPGSGKTSLVDRLEYDLTRSRFARVRCVEIVDRKAGALAGAIAEKLAPGLAVVEGEPAADRLARALAEAGKAPGTAVTLVLEDADWAVAALLDPSPTAGEPEQLRALWIALYQACGPRLSVIVTGIGCHALGDGTWHGWKNPLAHRVQEIVVPTLAEAELRRMIEELGRQARVVFSEAAVRLVGELSGGNVYAARRLCSEALRARSRAEDDPLAELAIGAEDVRAASRDLAALPDLFDLHALGEEAESIDRAVLRAVSDARPRGMATLLKAPTLSTRAASAQASIARLRRIGLVVVRDGRHEIGIPLMGLWLQNHEVAPDDGSPVSRSLRRAATGVAVSALIVAALFFYSRSTRVPVTIGACLFELEAPQKVAERVDFEILVRRDCQDGPSPDGTITLRAKLGDFVSLRQGPPGAAPAAESERYQVGLKNDASSTWPARITARATRVPSSVTVDFATEQHQLDFARDWANIVELDAKRVLTLAGMAPALLGLLLDYRDGIVKLLQRLFGGARPAEK